MTRGGTRRLAPPLSLLAGLLPAAAWGAFEAPSADPIDLALGGESPARPAAVGAPAAGLGVPLIGPSPRVALRLATFRWVVAPALERNAVALSAGGKCLRGVVSYDRLAAPGYGESTLLFGLGRVVGETGWGGGVALGVSRWGAPGRASRAWPILLQAAVAPTRFVRGAVRARAAVGAGARRIEDRVDAGVSATIASGWRLESTYEGRAAGGRLGIGLACAPTPGIELRGGFIPSQGSAAFGIGLRRGAWRFDWGQGRHPRLGAVGAVGLTLGWGDLSASPAPEAPNRRSPSASGEER